VLRVDPATMTLDESWIIPPAQRISDSDFGGSPTVFSGTAAGARTELVGACNKNGTYYAFKANQVAAGPLWTLAVGNPDSGECDAAAVWNGSHLFIGGPATTVGGTSYGGSISEVKPATGKIVWQTGLVGPVVGSPSEGGGGVVAAGTFGAAAGQNLVYLINASTGQVLKTLSLSGGAIFSQPVFADSYLIVAGRSGGLAAFAPKG
jgi:hypothetical protein